MANQLICNYGLFWKLEDVFLGRSGVSGHLQGLLASNLRDEPIDFREQQGVYVLYDANYRMVYVGQAGANDGQRLFDRLKQHTRDSLAERWDRFSWYGTRRVKKNRELSMETDAVQPAIGVVLNQIEAILISAAEPPHNKQGGRFGEEVQQYLQYRDKLRLGQDSKAMIKELLELTKTLLEKKEK